jgi:hypothetical protein
LNDNSVDFIAFEIDHVVGATIRFFGIRALGFVKFDEND